MCGDDVYKADVSHVRRRKQQVDDGASVVEMLLAPRDKFRVRTFLAIIDKLYSSLQPRTNSYDAVDKRLALLSRYRSVSVQAVNDKVRLLTFVYAGDLDEDHIQIANEFEQFFRFIQVHPEQGNDEQNTTSIQRIYKLLKVSGVDTSFSNVEILMRIYPSLFIMNGSGERSFSRLKRIKKELRATMQQERLAVLSIMCIKHDVLPCLDFDDIIEQFATLKARAVAIV